MIKLISVIFLISIPAFAGQWGHKASNGLLNGEFYQTKQQVVVAVIDTGIDVKHDALKDSLWVNSKEIPGNGIDDDKNGFVDDVHGWNFVLNNSDLTDNHGHGTHVSGIIGAKATSRSKIRGVAPNVEIMALKYFDPQYPGDNLKNTVKAIEYAIKMKVDVISYSGGGLDFSKPEYEAVKKAGEAGILFVSAAGNERANSDFFKYYPANYDLDNVISVTALNPNKRVLASSNYGVKTVDIAAPGENILSTLPNGRYGPMTGTSQAVPFITGTIAILKGKFPGMSNYDLIKAIKLGAKQMLQLKHKTENSSALDIKGAVRMMKFIEKSKEYDESR